MRNANIEQPICVSTDGEAGPYLIVPAGRLQEVADLLAKSAIPHWVDADVVSIDGKPALGFVNLSMNVDVRHVNELLKQL